MHTTLKAVRLSPHMLLCRRREVREEKTQKKRGKGRIVLKKSSEWAEEEDERGKKKRSRGRSCFPLCLFSLSRRRRRRGSSAKRAEKESVVVVSLSTFAPSFFFLPSIFLASFRPSPPILRRNGGRGERNAGKVLGRRRARRRRRPHYSLDSQVTSFRPHCSPPMVA